MTAARRSAAPGMVADIEPAEPDHAITDAELARVLEILQAAATAPAAGEEAHR